MANMVNAVAFIRRQGSALELARLSVLRGHPDVPPDSLAELVRGQRADGGWTPFWAPDASSVDATCYRLAQFEQLGVRDHAAIGAALAFLIAHQEPNGSFQEEARLGTKAPPWAKPGDDAARVYLTANAGYWIQYYQPRSPRLDTVVQFLTGKLTAKGQLSSFFQSQWLTAGLLYARGDETTALAILEVLRLRLSDLDASNLAWMINSLVVMGLSPKIPLIREARARLDGLQEADGRWCSADGAWQDVHTTLESLRAFVWDNPQEQKEVKG